MYSIICHEMVVRVCQVQRKRRRGGGGGGGERKNIMMQYAFNTRSRYRLAGLVVKASESRRADPGFVSSWRRDYSGSSHTTDLNIGIPVATLPGAGTGWPGVGIL